MKILKPLVLNIKVKLNFGFVKLFLFSCITKTTSFTHSTLKNMVNLKAKTEVVL